MNKRGSSREAESGASSSGGVTKTSAGPNSVYNLKVSVGPPSMALRDQILPWRIAAVVTPPVDGPCFATIAQAFQGHESIKGEKIRTPQKVFPKYPRYGYFVFDPLKVFGTDPFMDQDHLRITLWQYNAGIKKDMVLLSTDTKSFRFISIPFTYLISE